MFFCKRNSKTPNKGTLYIPFVIIDYIESFFSALKSMLAAVAVLFMYCSFPSPGFFVERAVSVSPHRAGLTQPPEHDLTNAQFKCQYSDVTVSPDLQLKCVTKSPKPALHSGSPIRFTHVCEHTPTGAF